VESQPPRDLGPEATVGALLRFAHRKARRVGNTALASIDMDTRRMGVLGVLFQHGPVTQRELCDELDVDSSTMVVIVDQLLAEALIDRDRNPADRRSYLISLTESGRERVIACWQLATGVMEELMGHFTQDEREQLARLLIKFVG
jgi:DNA-binding MarR family transcriptional regulator